jgi:ATP-dependent DNA helicase RecG
VEVRISPEELVVLSFPGPDHSICLADLRRGKAVARRYRNRRIGEFLKELDLTEGRATGIPKILRAMRGNGSPAPKFETDDERTSFLIRLPVHPQAKPVEDTRKMPLCAFPLPTAMPALSGAASQGQPDTVAVFP